MRKFWKHSLIVLVLLFPTAEIAARIIGWKALWNSDYQVSSTPAPWIKGDKTLGFQLCPGDFSITLNKALTFQTKHLADGTRWVNASDTAQQAIHFYGCSFTYGYGVDDEETFVYLLQQEFPSWHFRNFAVPGYGTAQAIRRLEEAIRGGETPAVAVLVYSAVHAERDVMAFTWRRALKIGFSRSNERVEYCMQGAEFPYWDADAKRLVEEKWDALYSNWAGRETFAIVNALQSSSEEEIAESQQRAGSLALVELFVQTCKRYDIRAVVVNLDKAKLSKKDFQELPPLFCPVYFDFSKHTLTNHPHDKHPNKKGHRFIFERIQSFLAPLLNA